MVPTLCAVDGRFYWLKVEFDMLDDERACASMRRSGCGLTHRRPQMCDALESRAFDYSVTQRSRLP
jgi:hypothetical protein